MSRSIPIKSLRPLFIALVLLGLAAIPAAGAQRSLLTFLEASYDNTKLWNASSVTVSPDGNHAYVTSAANAAVVVFGRNASSGELTLVEVQEDSISGVDGLLGAQFTAVSPDGNHVYVAGISDDAVAVFSRSVITGGLTYVEVQKDEVGGVDGLDGAVSIAVSPDNKHVYVAGCADDAVAIFSRSAITGGLSFVEVQRDGVDGVDGLECAYSVAVSPDGHHVYVTGSVDDAVAVFGRSAITGGLTYVEAERSGGLGFAESVAVSPDGFHVYVAGRASSALNVYSRNGSTGELTFVEMQQDGVDGVDGLHAVQSVAISFDGSHVYAASEYDNAVAVFGRNLTTGELTFVEVHKDGVGGVEGLDYANSVTVSSDGYHVYATSRDDSAVVAFSRNGTTGGLTYVKDHRYTDWLDGARAVDVSSDGDHVYVASREDNALVVFSRDSGSGRLAFVEEHRKGYLYPVGLAGANSVAVSPDGNNVYVASVDDNAVTTFDRSASTGELVFSQVITDSPPLVDGLSFATSVVVSPDGKHVYATAASDNAITTFGRYTLTGQLAYIEDVQEGDNHSGLIVDGLEGAYSVAISPDGYHVYVAGGQDDAVAVFARNNIDGHLTFIEVVTDTGSLVNGLDRPRSVTVSPDGENVYVASLDADTLAVYDRNPLGGNLTFVEIHQDGYGGVNGLDGAHSVAVSPDGLRVYAAGALDDVLVVFHRDPSTGQLTLAEEHRDNVGGVHGLEYPASIALSPSGSHVYVASYHDDAVVAFRRNLYAYLPLVLRNY